ncbi:hypothetical protein CK203_109220 [Vitis vinifera]|uniref:Reverse transcriptase domain-containing protein n=1 Tax=Vitis vinifera TaxID=29760 RepID=A0A438BLW4_VITVI|nr:hypothetical protein CK203_109220 [Vitis vinifera]
MIKENEKEVDAHVESMQLLSVFKTKPMLTTLQNKGLTTRGDYTHKHMEGKVDFTMTPMDDFKVVLGMDFLKKVKAMPLPLLYSMAILENEMSCVVLIVIEDKFMVVHLDDIVAYSNTLEEHMKHLRKVLKVLRQNELYVKKDKCSFLGESKLPKHHIKDGKLMMDDDKVSTAFKDLKKIVTEKSVLVLPDHTKVFEVHTNALDFTIKRVLM